MSLSSKNKKYIYKKIQDKKEFKDTLASWDFKSQIGNLNFDQISRG